MNTSVLAFSGSIASGKTTISLAASKAFHWKYAGFGNFIKKIAAQRKVQPTREVLQEIGNEMINSGWENFCWAVIQDVYWQKGDGLVLDGVRHIECLETLHNILYPMKIFLVYVRIDRETRKLRLRERGISQEDLALQESHSTEAQIGNLASIADLTVNGALAVDEIVVYIDHWLSTHV